MQRYCRHGLTVEAGVKVLCYVNFLFQFSGGAAVPPPGRSTGPPWCCRWCSPSAPSGPPCRPAASRAELHHTEPGDRSDPDSSAACFPNSRTHSAGTGSVWSTPRSAWSYSSSPPPAELQTESPNTSTLKHKEPEDSCLISQRESTLQFQTFLLPGVGQVLGFQKFSVEVADDVLRVSSVQTGSIQLR